ncbi:hypothetical protein EKD04_021195 [Chloroflexales bacterium ZM16-3]|nr:hypothetical protein [Chloroflexales bacterium ZM16-3]
MTPTTQIDERTVAHLSDAYLYPEAAALLRRYQADYALPKNQQLIGLLTFSRTWGELLSYVKHQIDRDWGRRDAHYKEFYTVVRRYLDDPKSGLYLRIKTQFNLIPDGLTKNETRAIYEVWSDALAREFIQHLVAEALYQTQGATRSEDNGR